MLHHYPRIVRWQGYVTHTHTHTHTHKHTHTHTHTHRETCECTCTLLFSASLATLPNLSSVHMCYVGCVCTYMPFEHFAHAFMYEVPPSSPHHSHSSLAAAYLAGSVQHCVRWRGLVHQAATTIPPLHCTRQRAWENWQERRGVMPAISLPLPSFVCIWLKP